jgi:uncharacterized protein (TIGR02145 family)
MSFYKYYLTYNGTTTEVFKVDGWNDIGREYKRSPKYHSVLRQFSVELGFHNSEAGKIIRDAYYESGLDMNITFKVTKYNHLTNVYDDFYESVIDAKPESLKFTRDFVRCSLIDSSKENDFATYDEINFNLVNRTAIDGTEVEQFETELSEIQIPYPDIYLHTNATGGNGLVNELSPFAEQLDYQVIDQRNEYPTGDLIHEVIYKTDLEDGTLTTPDIVIYSNTISDRPLEWRVDYISPYILNYETEHSTLYVDWTNQVSTRSIQFNEKIILLIGTTEHIICERTVTHTESDLEVGSTTYNLPSMLAYEYGTDYAVEENADVKLVSRCTYTFENPYSVTYDGFPYAVVELLKVETTDYKKYLTNSHILINENDTANKLGNNSYAVYENNSINQQSFDINVTTVGDLVLKAISLSNETGHFFSKDYKCILKHIKADDTFTEYDIYNAGTTMTDNISIERDKYYTDDNEYGLEINTNNTLVNLTRAINHTGSKSLTLDIGDKVELSFLIHFATPINNEDYTGNLKLESVKIDYSDLVTTVGYTIKVLTTEKVTVKGMYVHEAFYRAIQLALGAKGKESNVEKIFHSDLLGRTSSEMETYSANGQWSNLFITSGTMLRGRNTDLNVSILELFSSLDKKLQLCLYYDRTIKKYVVDTRDKAFKDEKLTTIESKGLEITLNSELFFNQVFTGHNDLTYDYIKGANEYDVNTEWGINSPVKNSIDLRSKYRTDTVGIVIQLLNPYTIAGSKDMKGDSDIFIIETDNGIAKLTGVNYTGFEGIETYLNPNMNPRQCLLRHNYTLYPQSKRLSDMNIRFIKNQKAIEYEIYGGSQTQLVATANLDECTLLPEIYDLTAPISDLEIAAIDLDPNKYMEFTSDVVTYNGWIDEFKRGDYKGSAKLRLRGRKYTQPAIGIYNLYAVNTGKLAPVGWRVSNNEDWDELIEYLGGESIAGGKLKEIGTTNWDEPNQGATNEYGFTAVASGMRNDSGTYLYKNVLSNWWSSSTPNLPWENPFYTCYYGHSYCSYSEQFYKKVGYAVRLVTDINPNTTIITDYDGNIYNVIKIGEQWWLKQDLKVTHFNDGEIIPNVISNTEWESLTTPAYCNYNNKPFI